MRLALHSSASLRQILITGPQKWIGYVNWTTIDNPNGLQNSFQILHYQAFKNFKKSTLARVKNLKKSQHDTCVNVSNSAKNIQT